MNIRGLIGLVSFNRERKREGGRETEREREREKAVAASFARSPAEFRVQGPC